MNKKLTMEQLNKLLELVKKMQKISPNGIYVNIFGVDMKKISNEWLIENNESTVLTDDYQTAKLKNPTEELHDVTLFD